MSERKLTFFTSDWHIGHKNCIQLDSRPFSDLDHMHRVLINNFNAVVPRGSITYFLGDVGLCSGTLISEVLEQLNGTKALILGNHDKNSSAMYRMGFQVVLNAATIYVANERVTMSHCPLRGVYREDTTEMYNALPGALWHGEHKQHKYSVTDEGQFHLHGHIHSPNGGKSQRILGKQFDVGVTANRYRPVSISEVESWIAKWIANKPSCP